MGLAAMYPALDRRNNLLRSMRGGSDGGCYDPVVDRASLYTLPTRARFWPGTDSLRGDEWHYWYGDIAIPEELSRPRRRPSCLNDEDELNRQLLRKIRAEKGEDSAGVESAAARGRRATAGRLESTISAAEESMGHLARARSVRATSVGRLQAARQSMERDARTLRASSLCRGAGTFPDNLYADIEIPDELSRPRRRPESLQERRSVGDHLATLRQQSGNTEHESASSRAKKYLRSLLASSVQKTSSTETTTMMSQQRSRRSGRAQSAACSSAERESQHGLDMGRVYVPRWLENHPIEDAPSCRRPPPSDYWPDKRPFYDLKNDYDTMLSFMGVTKDLRKAVVGGGK